MFTGICTNNVKKVSSRWSVMISCLEIVLIHCGDLNIIHSACHRLTACVKSQ